MSDLKRLRAETDEAYGTLLAGLGVSIPKSHAYIDALAAERAAVDAELDRLREALRVKHKALERLTYLYESEQDTEALERVGRPDWLRAALAKENSND